MNDNAQNPRKGLVWNRASLSSLLWVMLGAMITFVLWKCLQVIRLILVNAIECRRC